MNYYEELGIRSDADEEEIRKAHRRLVKLMHPDQHRDQGLKQLAETQMRRLNSIVAVLLDPEERREYDEQLHSGGVNGGDGMNGAAQQSSWRSVPWWIASTLGAIILTVGTIWLLADHYGNGRIQRPPTDITGGARPSEAPPVVVDQPPKEDPDKIIVQVPNTPAPQAPVQEPPKVVEESKPITPPVVATVTPPQPKQAEPPAKPPTSIAQNPPAVPVPDSHSPKGNPAVVKTTPPPQISKPATNLAAAQPPKPPVAPPQRPEPEKPNRKFDPSTVQARVPQRGTKSPLVDVSSLRPPVTVGPIGGGPDIPRNLDPGNITPPPRRDPLEGEWVYAPAVPEKRRPNFFPPEFISLKLEKDNGGGMKGQYSARYSVDRSVNPDVNFVLRATDQSAMKYVWTAANGAHGTLTIDTVEADVLRLEWRDTSKGHGPALTSGAATLVRKN